jgi:hypothetical protein
LSIGVPVVYGTALRRGDVVFAPTMAIAALAMFLGQLTTWLARRVLEPAHRLESARAWLAEA